MPIILPHGLTSAEIRVLQEFRRQNTETMTVDAIKAIKHPAGGGEALAVSLVSKGFLQTANGSADSYVLTQKAKDLLAIDPKPLVEETSDAAASAAANPDADGV
jgi:hypothetical protein